MGVAAQPGARARVKRHLVQILVVVANIQVRTLKAEVEKGSMGTAVGHGSGGPKRSGDSVQSYGVPYMCVCVYMFMCINYAGSPTERKGIGLIFPTLPTEIGGVCVLASTQLLYTLQWLCL